MKYMINFQVIVIFEDSKKDSFRTTYTILEDEINNDDSSSFNSINKWFNKYFYSCPLDKFIDTSVFKKKISRVEIKIGRITNALSGEYQTY